MQEREFIAYMSDLSDAEKAYLNGRVLPTLRRIERRGRRARVAHDLLMSIAMLLALAMPVLLLWPYAMPLNIAHLVCSGLSIAIVALLTADLMLRLPAHAALCAEKKRLLRTMLHAYFLGAEEFGGLDAEQKLLLLCSRAERLLA